MDHKTIEIKKLPENETNNIFLIGYMGTGKTETSKYLSKLLRLPYVDLDKEIENYTGKTISEIFDADGEEEFRIIETLVLLTSIDEYHKKKHLIDDSYLYGEGTIFSCGGGTALSVINTTAMANTGRIVLLTANPETIEARLSNSVDRPLLRGKTLEDIKEMLELRMPIYMDAADIIVSTDEKTPEEVAGEIVMGLGLVPLVS